MYAYMVFLSFLSLSHTFTSSANLKKLYRLCGSLDMLGIAQSAKTKYIDKQGKDFFLLRTG